MGEASSCRAARASSVSSPRLTTSTRPCMCVCVRLKCIVGCKIPTVPGGIDNSCYFRPVEGVGRGPE